MAEEPDLRVKLLFGDLTPYFRFKARHSARRLRAHDKQLNRQALVPQNFQSRDRAMVAFEFDQVSGCENDAGVRRDIVLAAAFFPVARPIDGLVQSVWDRSRAGLIDTQVNRQLLQLFGYSDDATRATQCPAAGTC